MALSNDLANDLAGSGLSNQLGGGAATRESILGPLLLERWHAAQNVVTGSGHVTSWAGLVAGIGLVPAASATAGPVFAVDGTNFNSRPVVQADSVGPVFLELDSGSVLAPATTKVFAIHVGRLRSLTGIMFVGAVSDSVAFNYGIDIQVLGGALRAVVINNNGTLVNPGWVTPDTSPHVIAAGLTGSQLTMSVDRVAQGTPQSTTGNFPGGLKTISVGGFNASGCKLSTAELLLLNGAPSAAQLTALSALFTADWGTP